MRTRDRMARAEREASLERVLRRVEGMCHGFRTAMDRRAALGVEFSEVACWESIESVLIDLCEAAPKGFGRMLRVWASGSDAESEVF